MTPPESHLSRAVDWIQFVGSGQGVREQPGWAGPSPEPPNHDPPARGSPMSDHPCPGHRNARRHRSCGSLGNTSGPRSLQGSAHPQWVRAARGHLSGCPPHPPAALPLRRLLPCPPRCGWTCRSSALSRLTGSPCRTQAARHGGSPGFPGRGFLRPRSTASRQPSGPTTTPGRGMHAGCSLGGVTGGGLG